MDSAEVAEIKRHIGEVAEGLDAKIEQVNADTRRHFGVIAEGLQSQIRQVAEAVSGVDSKVDRLDERMQTEFGETRAMIRFSYAELDSRVRRLEEKKG